MDNDKPNIKYSAKDIDTFKHKMIKTISESVLRWSPTSEADYKLALIETTAVLCDILSYYQEKYANEAYLSTTGKWVSIISKDFDTFKHKMITTISERVLGWMAPTSEADLDQMLIELISEMADELSDYQDRVVNEAYISTARKRISVARHARKRKPSTHNYRRFILVNALVLVCSICKQQITDRQSLAYCPGCQNPFHETHFAEAIKTKGKCSICKEKVIIVEINP